MFFLKFSDTAKNLDDFVKNGHIYINSFKYFLQHEKDGKKFDRYELVSRYHQHLGASLTLDEMKFKIAEPFAIRLRDVEFTHIFCLCAVTENSIRKVESSKVFDERLWEDFGNYVVLIHDPQAFVSRLGNKLKKLLYYYEADFIEYFDAQKFDGEVGAFRKRNIYEYQSEYRVAIKAETDEPLNEIYIGDLSDIAHGPVHKNKSINLLENGHAYL